MHRLLVNRSRIEEWISDLREEEREMAARDPQYAFVWIESFQVRSGHAIDWERLVSAGGFAADLVRLSRELAGDDERLAAFCREALTALLDHPKAGSVTENLSQAERAEWLRAAEELAIGLLVDEEDFREELREKLQES